ncbi:hypothetical protein [Rhodopila sp.]|uniref:hypothetical protein n=1 Tax=Rhodopila sp. TaxID=2480087 RepID=UPI003D120E58
MKPFHPRPISDVPSYQIVVLIIATGLLIYLLQQFFGQIRLIVSQLSVQPRDFLQLRWSVWLAVEVDLATVLYYAFMFIWACWINARCWKALTARNELFGTWL